MEKKTIAVVGASGSQGKGVVDALIKDGTFRVRAITRNPDKYSGNAHEVRRGDLNDISSLTDAFKDAYGVFAVTNFWEDTNELIHGQNAVEAAKKAEVQHFVWSTLPNVEKISNGRFAVPHFTGKAMVDELVINASFKYYTFVQAPFYFQNLVGMMGAQPKQDGTTGWTMPIDPTKKVIHMGDVNDLGKVVAGVFLSPENVGNGSYLSLAADVYSFNDVLAAFRENGKTYSFTQVPGDVYTNFFPGAGELAQMLAYFEEQTYMGPGAASRIELAKEVATGAFTPLTAWINASNK